MNRLENKIAIVTGGTSGIGAGISRAYGKEGATVINVGRNEERGKQIQKEIEDAGGTAWFYQADVSSEEEIRDLIQNVVEKYGKLDVFVNVAGIGYSAPLTETSSEMWDKVMNVNARAVFLALKYSAEYLVKSKGSFITIASMGGLKPLPYHYTYCASKAAAAMVTRVAALEYAATGARFNSICPGVVDTPILGTASPEVRKATEDSIPMKRLGQPQDIAGLAVYLGSDESAWVTGQNYSIDGGSTLL